MDIFSIELLVTLTKVLSFVGGAPNSEVRQDRPE